MKGLGFKTRPSTYRIGIAPTGRARCRKCKRLVKKGEVRVSITAFVRPNRSTCFARCVACIDTSFARMVLSVYRTGHRGSRAFRRASGQSRSGESSRNATRIEDPRLALKVTEISFLVPPSNTTRVRVSRTQSHTTLSTHTCVVAARACARGRLSAA